MKAWDGEGQAIAVGKVWGKMQQNVKGNQSLSSLLRPFWNDSVRVVPFRSLYVSVQFAP